MKIKIIIILLLGSILASVAYLFPKSSKKNPVISDILNDPNKFNNQRLTIKGTYGGWSVCPTSNAHGDTEIITRSDIMVCDESGGISAYRVYSIRDLNGNDLKLNPQSKNDYGKPVVVDAVVHVQNGKAYLDTY